MNASLIPAPGRQNWVNLCVFEFSLVYILISRPGLLSETLFEKGKKKSVNVMCRTELGDLQGKSQLLQRLRLRGSIGLRSLGNIVRRLLSQT